MEILTILGLIKNMEEFHILIYFKTYEFRMSRNQIEKIDKTRDYFVEKIKQNQLMSKKRKNISPSLNYIEHLLILTSTVTAITSRKKYQQNFSNFSTISVQQKLKETRFLSPKLECTSCLTSWRTTQDLGTQNIRKFQVNL